MPVLGGDALRMKLNTVHRKRTMCQPHDETIIGLCCDSELVRQPRSVNHERMVAGRPERRIDAAEYARALVSNLGDLAMALPRSAHDGAAKSLADRLMAEADAQHGDGRSGLGDELETDAGIARRTWTRRQHDRLGLHRHDLIGCDFVVA